MPFYYPIKRMEPTAGRRTADGLLRLRDSLKVVPQRSVATNLLLATWNIREFDSNAYGKRMDEAMYYIAEIISHFDLVAVQEVRRDLRALDELKRILGGWWRYIVTDVTAGDRGAKERLAFLYDSRKVAFGGVASEIVIPPIVKRENGGKKTYHPARQLARTPFLVAFKAGWFRFMLATVHILYGSKSPNNPERVQEIRELAQFMAQRASDETAWANNVILLGDFNIFSPADETLQALTDAGFVIPKQLRGLPANAPQTKFYDQIAFMVEDPRLQLGKAGVFNYYDDVFGEADEAVYAERMGKAYARKTDPAEKSTYYKIYWRTHQMSDHLPMWIELRTDFSEEYLKEIAATGG